VGGDKVGEGSLILTLETGVTHAAPAAPAEDPMEQLTKLGKLHEQGILTDEEFAAEKARILAG